MTLLNRRYSGVALNLSPVKDGGCVVPAPPSSRICPSAMCYLSRLFDQLLVSEPSTDYVTHCKNEALKVTHVTVIEPKRLFIHIPKQVEGFYRNIGPVETPLQKRPEILKAIGVNVVFDISYGVVNHLVLEVIQAIVRLQRAAVQFRSGLRWLG